MTSARSIRNVCAALMAVCLLIGPEADAFFQDAFVELDQPAEMAIARAQKWLASRQRSDGTWPTGQGRNNAGIIAYATLALMVNGSVPGRGMYGKEVSRGIQFLISVQKPNGLIIGNPQSGPMYQHALATLVLAECLGMTQSPQIRAATMKAINLVVDTQHRQGGWRYQPRPDPGDISVTVMQVMALRAAVEAGIYVPDETIERAVDFIKRCYNEKEKGFGYMNSRGGAGFARTAAGLVCLQSVGLHDDPIIPDVVGYIEEHAFAKGKTGHYWYGHYYTSVGLYHYGGEPWKRYYPRIRSKILKDWEKSGHYHQVLDTAWAVLILGVPYRYLPIYQR